MFDTFGVSLYEFQCFSAIDYITNDLYLNLQIANEKLQFREQAKSKVGSKDNIKHKPGGGDKTVIISYSS